MNSGEARKTLMADGWSRFSAPIGRAMYSKVVGGEMQFRDIFGEPCKAEPPEEVVSATDLAHEKVDEADDSALARFLMGPSIDRPTLDKLKASMSLEDILGEYSTADMKMWLGRLGVQTKSNQREQLIGMIATALNPEKEDNGES